MIHYIIIGGKQNDRFTFSNIFTIDFQVQIEISEKEKYLLNKDLCRFFYFFYFIKSSQNDCHLESC